MEKFSQKSRMQFLPFGDISELTSHWAFTKDNKMMEILNELTDLWILIPWVVMYTIIFSSETSKVDLFEPVTVEK